MKRYLKVKECDHCGNGNLEFSNYFTWNVFRQQYESLGKYEAYCTECEDQVPTREIIIEDYSLEHVQVI